MKQDLTLRAGESLWAQTSPIRAKPALQSNARADVCIVGAGIAGMSTAYMLALEGKSVIVVDDGPIGGGQTEVTTAHLSNVLDRRYYEIEAWRGAEIARLAAESHTSAIRQIEANVKAEQIECDFKRLDGWLFVPPGESTDVLDREYEAVTRTGAIEISRAPRAPLPDFDTGPSLRFAHQAEFHPLKYLAGLAAALKTLGGRIYNDTHVTHIEGGDRATIETKNGPKITSQAVVVATNTPINDWVTIHTKQAPYLSYVIAARVPVAAIPNGLYWDTADPYHYVRLQADESSPSHAVVIVGGEDHKTGQAADGDERFARLEQWARERFPAMEEVNFRWSGQVMESMDGLAFIGRNPLDKENVFVVTGDSGLGMTHGTIAGRLLTDLICDRANPWSEVYEPSRKPAFAAVPFLKENLNVARQYADWLLPGALGSTDELPAGAGGILQRGLSKVAVYRDPAGKLTELSAVCPHLQCIVQWNPTESTWDCPCHGSRFDCHGKVLNGPANSDLTAEK